MKFDGNSPEIFWSFVVDLQTLVEGIDGIREYESYRYTFRILSRVHLRQHCCSTSRHDPTSICLLYTLTRNPGHSNIFLSLFLSLFPHLTITISLQSKNFFSYVCSLAMLEYRKYRNCGVLCLITKGTRGRRAYEMICGLQYRYLEVVSNFIRPRESMFQWR